MHLDAMVIFTTDGQLSASDVTVLEHFTRGQLQIELRQIYDKTGITILFVTHDISEALKLGTKVLVMDQGKIEQYAAPQEVLQNPATPFVK